MKHTKEESRLINHIKKQHEIEIPKLIYCESEKAPGYCFVITGDEENRDVAYTGKNKKLAKLIAASPDLIEALKIILSLYTGTNNPSTRAVINAQAAIKKATE